MACSGLPIGHWVKTIVLGLCSNFFDVYSDVGSGLYHYHPKNVTRTFLANDTVPNNCNALTNSNTEMDHTHVCLEQDFVWATITFGCIQLPAVVLALCGAVGVCYRCARGYTMKVMSGCLLLLITPFPLVMLPTLNKRLNTKAGDILAMSHNFPSRVFPFNMESLEVNSCFSAHPGATSQ